VKECVRRYVLRGSGGTCRRAHVDAVQVGLAAAAVKRVYPKTSPSPASLHLHPANRRPLSNPMTPLVAVGSHSNGLFALNCTMPLCSNSSHRQPCFEQMNLSRACSGAGDSAFFWDDYLIDTIAEKKNARQTQEIDQKNPCRKTPATELNRRFARRKESSGPFVVRLPKKACSRHRTTNIHVRFVH
jgi:hypothetical protein